MNKPPKELYRFDYKFTKIELGKQSWLGCQQDASNVVFTLSEINNELWEKTWLKLENASLHETIHQQFSQPIATQYM